MPKLNIDAEAKRIFQPIEFTLDGKDYVVNKVECDALDDLMNSAGSPRGMRKAFAALLGVDSDEFKHTDVNKLTLAMRHINKSTSEAIESLDSKNVPKESVAKTV